MVEIMDKNLDTFARITGVAGILLALIAGLGRVVGFHRLAGFESLTLLVVSIALMAASCVVQLHILRNR